MTKNILMELLRNKAYLELKKVLAEYNPVDLAELLMDLEDKDLALVFRMMDDAVDLLEGMPANVVNRLLDQVSGDTRADINRLLKYADDSAGSIMTVEYIDVTPKMTVQEALDKIREVGIHSETIYTCYVVVQRKLVGIITAEALMTNDKERRVEELMEKQYVSIHTTVTGAIIVKYENAFTTIPLLVSFIPMLMDTGGNCGSQSSTLVIRGLAVDELHMSDFFTVVWKEFRVALVVGAALAFANGLRIYLVYGDVKMAVVIALSLVGTIIIAKIVGCVLPILAKQCRMDPAIMASPLITTVVDTCSIVIYFRIATLMFYL